MELQERDTWKITTKSSILPFKITVNKTDIFDEKKVADEFRNFSTNIGPDLANKVANLSKHLFLCKLILP